MFESVMGDGNQLEAKKGRSIGRVHQRRSVVAQREYDSEEKAKTDSSAGETYEGGSLRFTADMLLSGSEPSSMMPLQRKEAMGEPQVKYEQEVPKTDRETPVERQEVEKKAANLTGLPDRIKEGIEWMSGYDLSGVRVNYNSPKPAKLNAHAFTQGLAIEVAPGGERHVPHEAWHVVQQMQGRVKRTLEVNGVAVNGDRVLEREAEEMGAQAWHIVGADRKRSLVEVEMEKGEQRIGKLSAQVVQRKVPLYGLLINGQGSYAEVELEGKNDTNLNNGSTPSVDADWYNGLSPAARDWMRRNFVRGHLLNMHLGGTGKDMMNLAYITHSANTKHETEVESKVKDLVLREDKTVYYQMWADYTNKVNLDDLTTSPDTTIQWEIERVLPKIPGSIQGQWKVVEPSGEESLLHSIKNEGAQFQGIWK